MLSDFSCLLEPGQQLNDIVVIGAGAGSVLDELEALDYQRAVLVEPHPRLAKALASKVKKNEKCSIYQRWIGSETGETTLYENANPRHSSLCEPELFLQKFPNMKVTAEKQVKTNGINEFFADIDLAAKSLLVLDVEGLEQQLLISADSTWLKCFEWVVLRTSQERLHKNGTKVDDILQVLKDREIPIRYRKCEKSDYMVCYFQQDFVSIELNGKLLESQQLVKNNQQEFDKLFKLLDEKEKALALKELEFSNVINQLHESEKNEVDSSKKLKKIQEINGDLEKKYISCKNALDEEIIKRNEAIMELDKVKQENSSVEGKYSELLISLEELAEALEKTKKERDEQAHWHSENKKWAESLVSECNLKDVTIENHIKKISDVERERTIGSSLLLRLQLENEKLRDSILEKSQKENELKSLISDLYDKLNVAASVYHQIENEYPDLLINVDLIDD